MKKILVVLLPVFITCSVFAKQPLSVDLSAEAGFTKIYQHVIQSGTNGDKGDLFDYTSIGNQDILFPFFRIQADFRIYEKHHVILLYQPLTIKTEAAIPAGGFRYNLIDFDTSGGLLKLKYGFDFLRISYMYEIISPPLYYLSVGASLQIRNASIIFESTSSDKNAATGDIGVVPIIKVKTGYLWPSGFYAEFEGDGFYASNRFLNGVNYEFTGYIYDLSLRGGYWINSWSSLYLNFRFLGGGALGTNDEGQYTYNDLHTFETTIGVILRVDKIIGMLKKTDT